MYGKLANLCNDIPRKSLFNTGIFKQLCGGDAIYAEEKFKSGFSFINYAKLCFSCNQLPETRDDTDAFFRRIVIIDFPNVFSGENRDENLIEKLTTQEELSGLFNWALIGLERLLTRGDFSICASTQDTAREYKRRSSPISAFIMDCCEEKKGAIITKDELYDAYTIFCDEWDMNVIEKAQFGKKLRLHAPFIQEKRGNRGGGRKTEWVNIILKKIEINKNDNPDLENYCK
jgi:putative DNA primase/helicase